MPLVIRADAAGGLYQRVSTRTAAGRRTPDPVSALRNLAARTSIAALDTVETPRVLEHRVVAALFHVGKNRRDGLLDAFVLRIFEREQTREPRLEVGSGAYRDG